MRRIRNQFAHAKEKLHFDSSKTVALVKELSTYEAATSNQEAFLKAAGNVCEQAAKARRSGKSLHKQNKKAPEAGLSMPLSRRWPSGRANERDAAPDLTVRPRS
jgi:hypothetical protein